MLAAKSKNNLQLGLYLHYDIFTVQYNNINCNNYSNCFRTEKELLRSKN